MALRYEHLPGQDASELLSNTLIGDIQSFHIPQVCGWPCGEDAVKIVVRAAWSVKTVDHHDNDEYLIVLGEERKGGESLKSGFNKVGLDFSVRHKACWWLDRRWDTYQKCARIFGLPQTNQAISAVISNLLLKSGIQGNKYGTERIDLIAKNSDETRIPDGPFERNFNFLIEATIKTYPCGTIREESQSADMSCPVFSAPLPFRPGQYWKIISRSTSSACHSGTGLARLGTRFGTERTRKHEL
ncbi:hypothetical protein BofuT4_P095410.1 [Botrytis cinerea T4]|uniref:Uncharacterized protein n=1 Tax=Botryotinia fuckeliana (strain T4) TaxID=999810 RepID=G2YDI5_BOTF4|nr:hypothetical protein BofuT4_P095410.1 [Botrytis cinerea T4]